MAPASMLRVENYRFHCRSGCPTWAKPKQVATKVRLFVTMAEENCF